MDEITSGGATFKEAWAATPKARKRIITKTVQAGRVVSEETDIAAGYAQRQIKTSWAGYIGIIGLAFLINIIQGEDVGGNSLTWAILGAIVLIGLYSYWKLFQARTNNLALLESKRVETGTDDPGTEDPGTEDPGTEDPGTVSEISRLQGEGGPVTEVPEVHPDTPPTPSTPSASGEQPRPWSPTPPAPTPPSQTPPSTSPPAPTPPPPPMMSGEPDPAATDGEPTTGH